MWAISLAREDPNWLKAADEICGLIARGIAAVSVAIMIALAAFTVADAIGRTLLDASIPGIFEIAGFALAIGILACFPASVTEGSNLTIDFVAGKLPPLLADALRLVGGVLLALFLAILSWQFAVYAYALQARAQTMAAVPVPLAPFFWAAAAALAVCVPMQLVIVARRGIELFGAARQPSASDRASATRKALFIAVIVVLALFLVGASQAGIFDGLVRLLTSRPPLLGATLFLGVWVLILLLVPLGAAMGLMGLLGLVLLLGLDPGLSALGFFNARFISSPNLAVLPLFLLMGNLAVAAGLADDVYSLANNLLRNWRGGLAQATILGCAGFGAVTGSSIATAAAMGAVSLPEMRRRGYSPSLAAGCVAAGGTLGQLVPPSTIIVLYCFLTEVSIGRMFVAVLIPGLVTMLAFMAVIACYVRIVPTAAPDPHVEGRWSLSASFMRCWRVFVLIGLVAGGMYSGAFTANEAAAAGAVAAFAFAVSRGKLTSDATWRVMSETASTTAMLFMIIIGAITFSFFLGTTRFADVTTEWILSQNLPAIGVIIAMVVAYLVLGTALESAAILLITTPIVAPVVQHLGYDLIWWGIVMVVVVEAGIISPPYGLNMFIIQSMQPDIALVDIFRGVMPFFLATLLVIALLIAFPSLVVWLPSAMME